MSDPTLIIVVGAAQAVALALIAAALKIWGDRNHVDSVVKIAEVKEQVVGVRQEVRIVKDDVNGKMARLLEVTGQAEKAKGVLEGKAEQRAKDVL